MVLLAIAMLAAAAIEKPDAALVTEAEAAVTRSFRDPRAAQFRNLRLAHLPHGHPLICGEVNGKNAFGGYIGFQRFVYMGAGRVAADSDTADSPVPIAEAEPAWAACGWVSHFAAGQAAYKAMQDNYREQDRRAGVMP